MQVEYEDPEEELDRIAVHATRLLNNSDELCTLLARLSADMQGFIILEEKVERLERLIEKLLKRENQK